jgi:hypothetical protein
MRPAEPPFSLDDRFAAVPTVGAELPRYLVQVIGLLGVNGLRQLEQVSYYRVHLADLVYVLLGLERMRDTPIMTAMHV